MAWRTASRSSGLALACKPGAGRDGSGAETGVTGSGGDGLRAAKRGALILDTRRESFDQPLIGWADSRNAARSYSRVTPLWLRTWGPIGS